MKSPFRAPLTFIHAPSATVVARNIVRANTFLARGIGLLGKAGIEPGEGLWLPGTASVHTLGMRFALDIVFVDARGRAVRYAKNVEPGRWIVKGPGARSVVEMAAGVLQAVPEAQIGDCWRLELESCELAPGWNLEPVKSVI